MRGGAPVRLSEFDAVPRDVGLPDQLVQRHPAPQAAAGKSGLLVVHVVPWAEIFIDGEAVESANMIDAITEVADGRHTLRLVNPGLGEYADTVVVGASGGTGDTGSAYVFVRSGNFWGQQAKLMASDASAPAFFGGSISISGDTVLVGVSDLDLAGPGAAPPSWAV